MFVRFWDHMLRNMGSGTMKDHIPDHLGLCLGFFTGDRYGTGLRESYPYSYDAIANLHGLIFPRGILLNPIIKKIIESSDINPI